MPELNIERIIGDDSELLNSLDSYSKIEQLALLSRIAVAIDRVLKVENLEFGLLDKGDTQYLTYRFKYDNTTSKGAVQITGVEDKLNLLKSVVMDIHDGCEAITLFNSKIDDKISGVKLKLSWGRAAYCKLSNWDFKIVTVALSDKALTNLISLYRDGYDKLSNWIDSLSDTNTKSIFDILVSDDTVKGIFDKLEIEFSKSIPELLSSCMLNRDDIVKKIRENTNSGSKQTLRSLEVVNGLGTFAVVLVWKVNYSAKSINTFILDGTIIDLDNLSIISNNNLILSKIESMVTVKDEEISRIFNI